MGWADDFYDGTYLTDIDGETGTGLGVTWTYYVRRFLDIAKNRVVLATLGQPTPLPEGEGNEVQWHRYNTLAIDRSTNQTFGPRLSEGVSPDATNFTMQKLKTSAVEYGAYVQMSTMLKRTSIDKGAKGVAAILGEQASTTWDMLAHNELHANGNYVIVGDQTNNKSTDEINGVVDSATSTTITDTSGLATGLSDSGAADAMNQSVITITSGTGYGQTRAVIDDDGAGTITVAPAWDVTPAAGDEYHLCSLHDSNVVAESYLQYSNVILAVAKLRHHRAPTDENGYYVGIADPFQLKTLMTDDDWTALNEYRTDTDGIFKGEVGKFGGVRWVMETNPSYFPVTSIATAGQAYGVGQNAPDAATPYYTNYTTSASASKVGIVPIMGRDAFGVTQFASEGKRTKPPLYTRTPGPNSTDQPLPRFSTMGWYMPGAFKALNPMWCVGIAVAHYENTAA